MIGLDELLAPTAEGPPVLGTGTVVTTTPTLTVRPTGETAPVPMLRATHVTPVAGRQVVTVRAGVEWCVIAQMGA